MKKIFTSFTLLMIFFQSFSQKTSKVVDYTFEEATNDFQSITSTGNPIIFSDWDDGCSHSRQAKIQIKEYQCNNTKILKSKNV